MAGEFLNAANAHIHKIEREELFELMQRRDDWMEKAASCGCHQCQKGAASLDRQLEDELVRIFLNGEDWEEEWIAQQAMNMLGGDDE